MGRVLAKPLTKVIDAVVKSRYNPAVDSFRGLRAKHSTASPSELADVIISRYRKELARMGAASGGISAVPGIGTGIVVAGSVSKTG